MVGSRCDADPKSDELRPFVDIPRSSPIPMVLTQGSAAPRGVREKRVIVAVAGVVFRGQKVLAMRRAATKDAGAGLWETVSGRVDVGEDPLDAIRREIDEETGLDVEVDPRPVDAYSALRGTEPMMVIVYRARWRAGSVTRSAEHDAHDWLTPVALAERTTLTRLVEAVVRAAVLAWDDPATTR